MCREYIALEELLGRDVTRVTPATYTLTAPRTRWDAIRQGERLADRERGRLELGVDPIGTLADLLERQGVRILEIALPENISGLCLHDRAHGLAIIVNSAHHPRRRRFSYAHEYCHLLADRDRGATVSRAENREDSSRSAPTRSPPRSCCQKTVSGTSSANEARGTRVGASSTRSMSTSLWPVRSGRTPACAGSPGCRRGGAGAPLRSELQSALYRINLKLVSEAGREALAAQGALASRLRWLLDPEAKEDAATQKPARGTAWPSSPWMPCGGGHQPREVPGALRVGSGPGR